MRPEEDMARRIADCLEDHLHEYGWEPYRYPSGEHKGVHLDAVRDEVTLFAMDTKDFYFRVHRLSR